MGQENALTRLLVVVLLNSVMKTILTVIWYILMGFRGSFQTSNIVILLIIILFQKELQLSIDVEMMSAVHKTKNQSHVVLETTIQVLSEKRKAVKNIKDSQKKQKETL